LCLFEGGKLIDFTLSKINLLILVVALFSIISFFAVNVGKVFLVGEVKQELDKYSSTLNTSIIAPTTCDSKPFAIPDKFTSFGNNVFYKLYISTAPDPQGTRLIFAVSDIRNPDSLLAASSLATTATVVIFENAGGTFVPIGADEELELDPQSVPPRNAFFGIKSVKEGRTFLYIVPCAITPNGETCATNKQLVNEQLAFTGDSFVC
jgi:hypothetical protein